MPRTAPGLRTDAAARLVQLERQRPEWQSWLNLLKDAWAALDDAGWRILPDEADLSSAGSNSPVDAPLLHGRALQVDSVQVEQLLRRLVARAAIADMAGATSLRGYRPGAAEAVRLVGAALRQDQTEIAALADLAGVDSAALASVAHLAALPLLQWCGRRLLNRIDRAWSRGYCPVCAAWPTLAERRGLDRSRRMRCGRCSAEWEVQWLYCVYCGEREHERLGSLVPQDGAETLQVETCATCRGYLKSVATLQGIPPFELLLQDLETIELDLVALDRGYFRPQELGFQLDLQLIDDASGRDL